MNAVEIIEKVIGYNPRKVAKEEVEFTFLSKESLTINYRGMTRDFIVDSSYVYEEEGNKILFETSDLMLFPRFEELNECEDCNGQGYTEEFVGCTKPASECCGGCTANVKCDCENRFYTL